MSTSLLSSAKTQKEEEEEEEVPLEIEDYSCANTFERVVDDVERYLRHVFLSRPELHRFVYLRSRARPVTGAASPPPDTSSLHTADSSASLDMTSDSDSLVSALSSSSDVGNHAPLVISRTFSLQRTRRRGLSAEAIEESPVSPVDDITVEIHVRDEKHPVAAQFRLPLFFLVRSVSREVSYLATESTFYLSILATAVGNVFCAGQQYLQCTSSTSDHTDNLATPFIWHRGCAPCFVPVGDSYQELFEGMAPPIAVPLSELLTPTGAVADATTLRTRGSSSPGVVAMLIGAPVVTTHFRASALVKVPNNCQYLSDFLDLFQLHIGRRSHVQSSEFDGICVSVWKQYALSIPWRFLPSVLPLDTNGKTSTAAPTSSSAMPSSNVEPTHLHDRRVTDGPTWPRILESENALHCAVCGPFTYAIGTSTPPVEDICFSFGWLQLKETEAQENSRRTFLNPFTPSITPAGQVVQRRACVRIQPHIREASKYSHYVCDKLNKMTDDIFKEVYNLVANGASESSADPTTVLTVEEMRKLTIKVLAVPDHGISVAAQSVLLERFVQPTESTSATVQEALEDLLRHTATSAANNFAGNGRGAGEASSPIKDLRRGYFPGSFLCRFAHTCGEFIERPEDVLALWTGCVSWMKSRFDQSGREAIPQILRCLALPESAVAVDLSQTLVVQKLQLLAYCLRTMLLTPREKEKHVAELKAQEGTRSPSKGRPLDGWDEDEDANAGGNSNAFITIEPSAAVDDDTVDSFNASATLTLITNGEPLVVPPSVPSPPMTTDMLLQRAKELNDLGTGRGAELTRTWLQSDALYNDMCLFLHVNKAGKGRVVRFPDFIQWHSPRDFISPAQESAASSAALEDNAFLSDRMQKRENGVSHVWWALWERATPRSLEDIVANLFQEHEQVALVFRWLTSVVTLPTLLLEVVNASLANGSHRLLSHRHVIGGTTSSSGVDAATAAAFPATTTAIPELRVYLQKVCTAFTSNVEGAAAVFDAANAAAAVSQGAMEMEVETVRTLYATAISGLAEMESAVCAAVAVENLLGAHPEGSEAALVVRRASAPDMVKASPMSPLALMEATTTFSVWASFFMPRFVLPQDRVEKEMMARFTCMAERPLNTTGCFQQLVVQKRPDVLRLSLALTHEVL